MFIVASDWTEAQRLTSSFSLKGMIITVFSFEAVKTTFLELVCTPKSSMENPSLRVSGHVSSLKRTFYRLNILLGTTAETDFGQFRLLAKPTLARKI